MAASSMHWFCVSYQLFPRQSEQSWDLFCFPLAHCQSSVLAHHASTWGKVLATFFLVNTILRTLLVLWELWNLSQLFPVHFQAWLYWKKWSNTQCTDCHGIGSERLLIVFAQVPDKGIICPNCSLCELFVRTLALTKHRSVLVQSLRQCNELGYLAVLYRWRRWVSCGSALEV